MVVATVTITNTSAQEEEEEEEEKNATTYRTLRELQRVDTQVCDLLELTPLATSQQREQWFLKLDQLTKMRERMLTTLPMNTPQYWYVVHIEHKLEETHARLHEEDTNRIATSLRTLEIQEYQAERDEDHAHLIRVVVYMVSTLVLLRIVYNVVLSFGGEVLLPVYYACVCFVLLVGGYYAADIYLPMIQRDNMNYNRFQWSRPPVPATK